MNKYEKIVWEKHTKNKRFSIQSQKFRFVRRIRAEKYENNFFHYIIRHNGKIMCLISAVNLLQAKRKILAYCYENKHYETFSVFDANTNILIQEYFYISGHLWRKY